MWSQRDIAQAATHTTDRARIEQLIDLLRSHDTEKMLAAIIPKLTAEDREAVGSHCRFAHAATLVFPRRLADVLHNLRTHGTAGEITPSVVVRDRLCRRYALPAQSLEIGIVRAPVAGNDGQTREIELFMLAKTPGTVLEDVVAGERANQHETHVAFEVGTSDKAVLSGLRAILTTQGGLVSDGGGYNGYEDATVLYFHHADCANPLYRRLELIVKGRHSQLLQAHLSQSSPPDVTTLAKGAATEIAPQPAKQLLQLMTGAWTTQAIAVAAELALADHLARNDGATCERLAQLTDTDPDALGRLLRYLASLGVVRSAHGRYRLTDLGQPLRTDVAPSLQPLALMYGGPFYYSFGSLMHTMRTGQEAFAHVFGKHHFAHFAERPELAALFDRAMESSAAMFAPLVGLVDFTAANVVVDVAGGNGALLAQILRSTPHLRGVLLERPHAIEAARATLARAGCLDRCEFVVGDFTRTVPPGADVYILSRILHDWSDEQCRTILARCAEAMPAHADLLVVERLLPEDDTPSLAVTWDLHMMCNVGGRERTARQYGRLLAEAGFDVALHHALPLDAALLRAIRRPSAPVRER